MLKAIGCPFCTLDTEGEKVFYEDSKFIIVRTNDLKGHRERIMIVFKRHMHSISRKSYERALDLLAETGRRIFSYTPKFIVMDTTFATINDHWHLVATDLNPKSEDFDQILATRWIQFVDNTTNETSSIVR